MAEHSALLLLFLLIKSGAETKACQSFEQNMKNTGNIMNFSHVTDSGFWIVKEYFGLTVVGALKSYTVATCIASVVAISMTLLLSTIL